MNKTQTEVLEYLGRAWPSGSGFTLDRVARFGLGDNTYAGKKVALSALRALKRAGLVEYHGFNKVWYVQADYMEAIRR